MPNGDLPPTPPAPPAEPPANNEPPAPDLAAELAATKAIVAELTAKNQAAEAAAEAARIAGLSEVEKLAEERAGIAKEREGLVTERRYAATDKLGILPKFRHLAPAVDPADEAGARALQAWAKENPELVAQKPGTPTPPPQAPEGSMLAKVLSGQVRHPFMTATGLGKLLGGNQ